MMQSAHTLSTAAPGCPKLDEDHAVEHLSTTKAKAKAEQVQEPVKNGQSAIQKLWAKLLGVGLALRVVPWKHDSLHTQHPHHDHHSRLMSHKKLQDNVGLRYFSSAHFTMQEENQSEHPLRDVTFVSRLDWAMNFQQRKQDFLHTEHAQCDRHLRLMSHKKLQDNVAIRCFSSAHGNIEEENSSEHDKKNKVDELLKNSRTSIHLLHQIKVIIENNQQMAVLRKQNDELLHETSNLKKQNDELLHETSNLKKRNDELLHETSTLKKENAELLRQVTNMRDGPKKQEEQIQADMKGWPYCHK